MKFFKPFEPPVAPDFPDREYNITDFGAKEGKDTPITEALKKAITKCSQKGGGRVVVPAGNWFTGPIHLKSNVNLHFSEGALVKFSTNFDDYLPVVFGMRGGIRCYSVSHFIYAYRCKNIAVTGKGILDGNGEAWWYMKNHQPGMVALFKAGRDGIPVEERVYDKPEYGVRPEMLQFLECENVLIEGITMQNSPSWTVHPVWCENIIVRRLKIRNPYRNAPNTDGVDLESCKRGLIEHCDIATGDDAICLKSGRAPDAWEVGIPCEDMEIRNCIAHSGHGGITIGSETSAGISNAYIHDCNLGDPYSAIRIKTMKGRGRYIKNLDFENISIDYARDNAILITLQYAGESLDDQSQPKTNIPEVSNIYVSGFKCKGAKKSIELYGDKDMPLKNIYLSDVVINSQNPMAAGYVEKLSMENVNIYGE